jgi:hypothetical protein
MLSNQQIFFLIRQEIHLVGELLRVFHSIHKGMEYRPSAKNIMCFAFSPRSIPAFGGYSTTPSCEEPSR